jgi:secreted PhoX family phosphatase
MQHQRRTFLLNSLTSSVAVVLGPGGWRRAFAGAVPGPSPYGELGDADSNGVRLPSGFTARCIATTGQPVAATGYVWHGWPDGGATFGTEDAGWVYVSNSELDGNRGGASAIRFDAAGKVVAAYRILEGTSVNCAGGRTPWNTWLSCEEHRQGRVWECNPFVPGQGVARPAMGIFKHEAAAVDPGSGYVYLTEDTMDSRLYRFRPATPQDLAAGVLEAAALEAGGRVRWIPVPPERPHGVPGATSFARGEGAWFSGGYVYFCTTADHRVWALDTAKDKLEAIYDAVELGAGAPLREPDNVTVHEPSGDIYVAEDDDDLQLVLLADRQGQRIAAPFLQLVGHGGSEIAGPAFSPDGTRLYFSSQRGTDALGRGTGMTFEVSGPFRVR